MRQDQRDNTVGLFPGQRLMGIRAVQRISLNLMESSFYTASRSLQVNLPTRVPLYWGESQKIQFNAEQRQSSEKKFAFVFAFAQCKSTLNVTGERFN